MDDQKNVNVFGFDIPESVGDLSRDVLTLAELHARLARADWQETAREARGPTVGLILGLLMLASAVPIGLIGIAETIVEAGWLPRGPAYLVVALGAILVAVPIVRLSARGLARCGRAFRRSKHELNRNLQWLLAVLSEDHHPRRSRPPFS